MHDFQGSGFFSKIEQLIKDKSEEEKEQKKNSDEIDQLSRIYIKMMLGSKFDQKMIDICFNIIHKNIINLICIIDNLKEENNDANRNEIRNDEAEKQFNQSAQLIKIISFIKDWNFKIPYQIIDIMKRRILPMIHLNCSEEIKCSQRIIIQAFPSLQELHEAVFQALIEVSKDSYDLYKYILNEQNIIPHFASPIIQFASQSQLNKKTNQNKQQHQQQSEHFPSSSQVSNSLLLLNNQIKQSSKCQIIVRIPNLLHSLVKLSNFKQFFLFNQEQEDQQFQIRQNCRDCLENIEKYGDEQVQDEFVDAGYTRVLIISLSTAGGSEDQNDVEIEKGLRNILFFLFHFQNQRNLVPSQQSHYITCEEQIEDEGGNEEIEALLINKGKSNNSGSKNFKDMMKNFFIDESNKQHF